MKKILLVVAALVIGRVGYAQSSTDTLTLSEAVQLAINASPAIMQGEAAVDAAHARIGQVEAPTKPQLEASASYTRIDPTISVDFPINGQVQKFSFSPNDNYQAGVTLQQNIYDFGRNHAQVLVAESTEQAAKDNLEQYRSLAAYQTVQVYYGLLSTDEGIRVEQEQLRVLRENLGITQERERAGTATTLDPLNTQVRIASIQSAIADLQATRTKQEASFRRLTGLPSGTAVRVTRPRNGMSLPASLDSLHALAALHRSELLAAKDAERTAQLQVEAAGKGDNPILAANITAGIKDGYPPDLTKPEPNWAGTIGIHVPLLDGGRVRSQVEEAEANLHAAQARTLDVERSIQSEIEQAYADVQASNARLKLTTTQIEQARQAYDIALLRYRNGAATNLDVLTAETALEQANLQRSQLAYMYELNQYNLNRAVGTALW